jgi:hypothetical protein
MKRKSTKMKKEVIECPINCPHGMTVTVTQVKVEEEMATVMRCSGMHMAGR